MEHTTGDPSAGQLFQPSSHRLTAPALRIDQLPDLVVELRRCDGPAAVVPLPSREELDDFLPGGVTLFGCGDTSGRVAAAQS
jgi:hypothetical protein